MAELFCRECIAAMSDGDFYFRLVIFAVASLWGLWLARKFFIRARLIEDMPTSRIRSASQGYVELVGMAELVDTPRISPLSNSLCLWWRYTIERYQKTGKSRSWVIIEKNSSSAPFHIRDSTGICQVVPDGAEIHTHKSKQWYGSSRRPISGPIGTSRGFSISIGGFGNRYRYTEYLLLENDPLYCLGHFVSDSEGRRTMALKNLRGEILRSWKADYATLLESYDSDNNGELDLEEWQTVQHAAEKEALKQQKNNQQIETGHQLIKPKSSGLPFIIATDMQEKLSGKYRWKAFFSGVLFLAAGTMSTWLLSARVI